MCVSVYVRVCGHSVMCKYERRVVRLCMSVCVPVLGECRRRRRCRRLSCFSVVCMLLNAKVHVFGIGFVGNVQQTAAAAHGGRAKATPTTTNVSWICI